MQLQENERLDIARKLMHDFAQRTGLLNDGDNIAQRYLWTDAFAVQTFFSLTHALRDDIYKTYALKLIDAVHHVLGRFSPNDLRKGWISGYSEEEGEKHPTAGGLRIGKKLPERKPNERFEDRLEWERDGQYFHYLTRWIQALLATEQETGEGRYALWAAELMKAGARFIDRSSEGTRMFWKMSIDLSRPLISSMGAHDPLDGLVCAISIMERGYGNDPEQRAILKDLKLCCEGRDWATVDALGIGGLLLNLARLAGMNVPGKELPENVQPQNLLQDALYGLEWTKTKFNPKKPATERLAFRECGLSLGLRVIMGLKEKPGSVLWGLEKTDRFIFLANDIEAFWIDPKNQSSPTWTEHLDINAISLAASLVTGRSPSNS
jgi:hypothetical protein